MPVTAKRKPRGGFLRACALLLALLVYVSVCSMPTAARSTAATLERQFAAAEQETTRERAQLAQRFEASRSLVAEMLANEREEMALFQQETRFKMQSLREVLREEMRAVGEDVRALAQAAVANATAWRRQRQKLRDATDKTRDAVKASRERRGEREARGRLEAQERAQEQERARLELEEQEQERARREKQKEEKQEKEREQLERDKAEQERKEEDARLRLKQEKDKERQQRGFGREKLPASEGLLRELARWSDAVLLQVSAAVKLVSRKLLLPVGAILGLFLLATVAIAKYNAVQQARRRKRILYSSYPKNYRPTTRQRPKQTQTATKKGDEGVGTAPPLHWRPRRRAAMGVKTTEYA